MKEQNINIFENRILLFMDILGSKKIVSAKNAKSVLVKEIITSFSSINKRYSKSEIQPKPEECELIRLDKPFTENCIEELPGDFERVYIREGNAFFYVIKRMKKIDQVNLPSHALVALDQEVIGDLEYAVAKKLKPPDFEKIEKITGHTHKIGIISFGGERSFNCVSI